MNSEILGPEWKYHVIIKEPAWHIVENWCNSYIGEFDKDWYKLGVDPIMWIDGNTQTDWYFKEEKHCLFFKLRWQ